LSSCAAAAPPAPRRASAPPPRDRAARRCLRRLDQGHLGRRLPAVPHETQRDLVPGPEPRHLRAQLLVRGDRAGADRDDDVAALQAGARRGAVRVGVRHDGAAQVGQAERPRQVRGQRLHGEPGVAPDDAAVLHEVVEHLVRHGRRDGEADPLVAAAAREDRRVDADHLAARVDQRPARVAGVDGGVGLDEVFVVGEAEVAAADGTDDPHRHGPAEAERVPERQDDVADLHGVGVAEGRVRQVRRLDAERGEIRARVDSEDARRQLPAIRERHPNLGRVLDHVMVGQDGPMVVHEDARPEAHLPPLARNDVVVLVAEELLEERVGHERGIALVGLDHLHRGDVHDRRHHTFGDRRVAVAGGEARRGDGAGRAGGGGGGGGGSGHGGGPEEGDPVRAGRPRQERDGGAGAGPGQEQEEAGQPAQRRVSREPESGGR